MRGVTDGLPTLLDSLMISTHTPHARRDNAVMSPVDDKSISTHTPHARRDIRAPKLHKSLWIFLLTRLMRGVTAVEVLELAAPYFYSHASCEA